LRFDAVRAAACLELLWPISWAIHGRRCEPVTRAA
jgi:hypothetical protein